MDKHNVNQMRVKKLVPFEFQFDMVEKHIHAFEMWVWHIMFRISWTQRKTNIWVRDKVFVKEGLLCFITTPSSIDLAYHESGSFMSQYVMCE